jgi:hypothetical protein
MTDGLHTFVVDTLGFRVPCRSFHVRANITRDRPLPVVDEFVLRLLRICGQLTLMRLAEFFGFARTETERVVRDLVAKELIVAEDNELRLTTRAAALFRASAEEEPRLVEVEPWVENVWIDLVSRTFVPRPRQRAHRNLIDVQPASGATDLPVDFARVAFEENFRDYITRVRRLREPDRVSIHSIAGVEPDRYGSVVITGRKVITIGDRRPRLEFDGASEAPKQFRTMIENLATEYGQLDQPRAQTTSLVDFERFEGLQLRTYFDQNQEFDLARWLAERPQLDNSSRAWVLGASYLEANVKAVVDRLNTKKPDQIKPEIRWLRPAGGGWGMSADLSSALEILRRIVGLPETPRFSGSTLLMPRAVGNISQKRISRLFERGEEFSAKLGTSLEVLVVGRTVAMLLIHVSVDRNETIPVGIVTDHPDQVARLDGQLRGEHRQVWVSKARRRLEADNQDSSNSDRTLDLLEE